MKIIVLMGFPGSGKSTWAKSLPGRKLILSSDNYFTDKDGNYNWTIEESHKGHEDCLRKFIDVFQIGPVSGDPAPLPEIVIIDNTNVRIYDIIPYIRIAQAYECPVEVKYINTDIEIAKSRNIHRVPAVAYDRMKSNFEKLLQLWPKDFPQIEFIEPNCSSPTKSSSYELSKPQVGDVVITDIIDIEKNIIPIIKWIRGNTKLSLRESKDLLDNLPAKVITNVYKIVAEVMKLELESIGAKVKIC